MTASPMSPITGPITGPLAATDALARAPHSFARALLGFMLTTATVTALLLLVRL